MLLALLFVTNLFAQSNTLEIGTTDKSLDLNLVPVTGIHALDLTVRTNSVGTKVSESKTNSENAISLGMLVEFAWSGNRYFNLGTGLFYSNLNGDFFVRTNPQLTETYHLEMQRLTIPLTLTYFPIKRNNGLFFKGGILGQIPLGGSEKVSTTLANQGGAPAITNEYTKNLNDSGYKPITADAYLALGFHIVFLKTLGFHFEVGRTEGLTSIIGKDREIQTAGFQGFLGLSVPL